MKVEVNGYTYVGNRIECSEEDCSNKDCNYPHWPLSINDEGLKEDVPHSLCPRCLNSEFTIRDTSGYELYGVCTKCKLKVILYME